MNKEKFFGFAIKLYRKVGLLRFLFFVVTFMRILRSNRLAHRSEKLIVAGHMGFGDQIICLPIYRHLVVSGKRIEVIVPRKALDFLCASFAHPNLTYTIFEDISPIGQQLPMPVSTRILRYAKKQRKPVLVIGHELLRIQRIFRPDLDFNAMFYKFARVPLTSRTDLLLSERLRDIRNGTPLPDKHYALVDHFPGTIREIPESILNDIEARGLEVVLNPREVPYLKLIPLIENATELHFVNSSLFCLSLLLDLKAKSKNIYLMQRGLYHGLGFYNSEWQEWILNDSDRMNSTPSKFDSEKHLQQLRKTAAVDWRVLGDKFIFGGKI